MIGQELIPLVPLISWRHLYRFFDDDSIEGISRQRNFPATKACPVNETFDPRSFIPAKSPLIRSSAKTSLRRRQVQNERHLGCSLRAKKKKWNERRKKREEGVLPLGPAMTKATSKVFLMDSPRCLCGASNRYQNFLV